MWARDGWDTFQGKIPVERMSWKYTMANTIHKRPRYQLSLGNEFISRVGFAVRGFPLAILWYHCCELILNLLEEGTWRRGGTSKLTPAEAPLSPRQWREGVSVAVSPSMKECLSETSCIGVVFWSQGDVVVIGSLQEQTASCPSWHLMEDVPARSGDGAKKIPSMYLTWTFGFSGKG